MKSLLSLSIIYVLCLPLATAAKYYVGSEGANSNTGTHESPWEDIAFALEQVKPESGDTIFLIPGTYLIEESIRIPIGVNFIGLGIEPHDVLLEYNGNNTLAALIDMRGLTSAKKKSIIGESNFSGNQEVKNFSIEANEKVLVGLHVSRRNNVKVLHLHLNNCVNAGIIMSTGAGLELGYCRIIECSRQHENKINYYKNVELHGWEGGSMHHCEIIDVEGGVFKCGYGLELMNLTRTKIHGNNIFINTYIDPYTETNYWPVFAVLSGFTAGVEFFNNQLNGCLSCEHRVDGSPTQNEPFIPGTMNLMITNNKFIGDREGGVRTQAIEMYVDFTEISGNYFENFRTCIQSWKGDDTLKNILIHHNIFNANPGAGEKAIGLRRGGKSYENPDLYTVYQNFQVYNNVFDGYDNSIFADRGENLNFEIKNNISLNVNTFYYSSGYDDITNVNIENNLRYNTSSITNVAANVNLQGNVVNAPGMVASGSKPFPWYSASSAGSYMVDKGVDLDTITMGYAGEAPDLGAYERDGTVPHRLQMPVFTPPTGKFLDSVMVEIIDYNDGADYYYTLDGTLPSKSNGMQYTSPIVVKDTLLRAVAFKENMLTSFPAVGTYAVHGDQAPVPEFSISGGEYDYPQVVSISSTLPGSEIYYREDVTTPIPPNALYEYPIYIDNQMTLSAIAVHEEYHPSEKVTHQYVIKDKMPINGIVINNTNEKYIEYGNGEWELTSDQEGYYMNDYHQVYGDDQYVEFTFNGTGCAVISETQKFHPNKLEIALDDQFLTYIDLNTLDKVHDTIFVITGLENSDHILRLKNMDTYRYLTIDAFVCFDCDTTTSIQDNELSLEKEFMVYPNPASNKLFFKDFTGLTGTASIHGIDGRIYILEIKDGSVDISSLQKGFYILTIQNNGRSHRTRFMKLE